MGFVSRYRPPTIDAFYENRTITINNTDVDAYAIWCASDIYYDSSHAHHLWYDRVHLRQLSEFQGTGGKYPMYWDALPFGTSVQDRFLRPDMHSESIFVGKNYLTLPLGIKDFLIELFVIGGSYKDDFALWFRNASDAIAAGPLNTGITIGQSAEQYRFQLFTTGGNNPTVYYQKPSGRFGDNGRLLHIVAACDRSGISAASMPLLVNGDYIPISSSTCISAAGELAESLDNDTNTIFMMGNTRETALTYPGAVLYLAIYFQENWFNQETLVSDLSNYAGQRLNTIESTGTLALPVPPESTPYSVDNPSPSLFSFTTDKTSYGPEEDIIINWTAPSWWTTAYPDAIIYLIHYASTETFDSFDFEDSVPAGATSGTFTLVSPEAIDIEELAGPETIWEIEFSLVDRDSEAWTEHSAECSLTIILTST
jgi:hypothetical protein